jgi:hypothetical protein
MTARSKGSLQVSLASGVGAVLGLVAWMLLQQELALLAFIIGTVAFAFLQLRARPTAGSIGVRSLVATFSLVIALGFVHALVAA